jgi:gluconolactonase
VPLGGDPEAIQGAPSRPNGITLSEDETVLYIAGQSEVRRFDVMVGGALANDAQLATHGGDGMGMDCAGNLYVTTGSEVAVYDRDGGAYPTRLSVGMGNTTNAAFGGPNRTTLFVTTLNPAGLWQVELDVPGLPY